MSVLFYSFNMEKFTQSADRLACSCLVHQVDVIKTKPGEIVDSNIPRKKRTVARPANDEQEAVIIKILAQAMILIPRNFATGNL